MSELLAKDEVYAVIGAAMEVYNELGPGFLESVYQEALELELINRDIPFKPQCELLVQYKNHILKKGFLADFVAYNSIIVEIKALEHLSGREEAQLINYLKATGLQVGLLINFGHIRDLEWKRMILTQKTTRPKPTTSSEFANLR